MSRHYSRPFAKFMFLHSRPFVSTKNPDRAVGIKTSGQVQVLPGIVPPFVSASGQGNRTRISFNLTMGLTND